MIGNHTALGIANGAHFERAKRLLSHKRFTCMKAWSQPCIIYIRLWEQAWKEASANWLNWPFSWLLWFHGNLLTHSINSLGVIHLKKWLSDIILPIVCYLLPLQLPPLDSKWLLTKFLFSISFTGSLFTWPINIPQSMERVFSCQRGWKNS